jgi:Flp pilus assembly protein TadB
VKNFLQWLITLVVVMTVIIGAERIPSLKKADIVTEQHHRPLVAVTLALTVIGFLLFMGGVIYGSMQSRKPLTHEQIQDMTRQIRYPQAFFSKTWFRGKSWGRGFEDEFSISEAKQAGISGWNDPRWRRNFVISIGALVMAVGLFSLIAVLAPVGVKLLVGGALLYTLVRLTWAVARE